MPHDPERMKEYERAIQASMLAAKFIKSHPGCRIACGHSLGRNKLFFVVFGDAYTKKHEIEVPPDAPDWAIDVAIAAGWAAIQQGGPSESEAIEAALAGVPEPADTHAVEERAAIMEFDGGLTRGEAEARAKAIAAAPTEDDPYIQEAVSTAAAQPVTPAQWDDW